jgi:AcrR family transcriptional regulator
VSQATPGTHEPPRSAEERPRDGRHRRWNAHRATRRDEIITAAIVAIRRHGAGAGMDRIAAVAGTSKPVIYRYFADKNDLHRAVSQRVIGEVLTTLEQVIATRPEPRELILAGVDAYLALLEASPELYRFVVQHPSIRAADSTRLADFSTVVAELLAEPLAAHLDAVGIDGNLAHPWAESIVGFISAASLWWLDHRDAMTRDQLAGYLGSLLWAGAAGVYHYVGRPVDAMPVPGVFHHRPG